MQNHSLVHANGYAQYLTDNIARLAVDYADGKLVERRPDLRYRIVRRRVRGHGHVLVFTFDANEVHLLHVFHTAQDFIQKLISESG